MSAHLNSTQDQTLHHDTQPKHTSAQELQNWAGSHTLLQAFTALLPNYEDRAIQVGSLLWT